MPANKRFLALTVEKANKNGHKLRWGILGHWEGLCGVSRRPVTPTSLAALQMLLRLDEGNDTVQDLASSGCGLIARSSTMLGRLRLFLIIGLVMLPLTSANSQWQGSAQINLWALPYCDPVVNTRYDFGQPVGSVVTYRSSSLSDLTG